MIKITKLSKKYNRTETKPANIRKKKLKIKIELQTIDFDVGEQIL